MAYVVSMVPVTSSVGRGGMAVDAGGWVGCGIVVAEGVGAQVIPTSQVGPKVSCAKTEGWTRKSTMILIIKPAMNFLRTHLLC